MLKSDEYAAIKEDYDRISRTHFDRSYFHPKGMSFANSDALFPSQKLASIVGPAYKAQCHILCYGPYPSWPEIESRFLELRTIL